MYRIAMVVGEASGDNLAAGLMDALTRRGIDFEVVGICGPAMIERHAKAIHTLESISAIGFEGVFARFAKILSVRAHLIRELLRERPDIYVGVDAPDFNLGVELKLRRAGIPTVQYVSPAVWAWRGYRIRKIRRAAQKVLSIFPFESGLFKRYRVAHAYVGHPLADKLGPVGEDDVRKKLGFASHDIVIALLPGSRTVEVKRLGLLFVEAAALLARQRPQLKFIMPAATDEIKQMFEAELASSKEAPPIQIVGDQSIEVMKSANVVLLASGTAALEAALLAKPLVVAYKVSRLTYILVKLLANTNHFCVLNHLVREPFVPEFIQADATAHNVVAELNRLLDDNEYRTRQIDLFTGIAEKLRCGASDRAAGEIESILRHER